MKPGEIHAITFKKDLFNINKVKKWFKDHNKKYNRIETNKKPNIIWVNITPKTRYKNFSTVKTQDGINFVIGYP